MYKYLVKSPGVYGDRYYSPTESKLERRFLEVPEKLNPLPDWLEPIQQITEPKAKAVNAKSNSKISESTIADFSGGKVETL